MKTEQTAQSNLYIGIDIHKRSWKIHCSTDLFPIISLPKVSRCTLSS